MEEVARYKGGGYGYSRGSPRHVWKQFEEEALLHIVDCESSKGRVYYDGRFRPGFINDVFLRLRTACPLSNIEGSQIKSKLATFKSNYNSVCDVLRVDGFSWDVDRNCVRADNGAWDRYLQNGGSAKWRGKVYPVFVCLDRIFGQRSSGLQNKGDSITVRVGVVGSCVASINCSLAEEQPADLQSGGYSHLNVARVVHGEGVSPDDQPLHLANSSPFDSASGSNCFHQHSGTDFHVWKEVEDNALLEAMKNVLSMHKCVYSGRMKGEIYSEVAEQLRLLCPASGFQVSHIKNRMRRLKSDYETIKCLLRLPGFTWNSSSKCVEGDDAIWNEHVLVNKKAVKWRSRSCHLYDSLCGIFEKDSVVEGNGDCLPVGGAGATVSRKHQRSIGDESFSSSKKRFCVGPKEDVGFSALGGVRVAAVPNVVPVRTAIARIIADLEGQKHYSRGQHKKHKWVKNEEDALLRIFVSEASRGHHWCSGRFKGGVLATAASKFRFLYPNSSVTSNQIKRRVKFLRSTYDEVRLMLSTPGFSWNENRNCLEAADDVWDAYLQHNKKAKKWRKKTFLHYNALAAIFNSCGFHGGGEGANGTGSCSSRFTRKSVPRRHQVAAYRKKNHRIKKKGNQQLLAGDQLCSNVSDFTAHDDESISQQSMSMFGQHYYQSKRAEFSPLFTDLSREYDDLGDKCYACRWCSALFWADEAVLRRHNDGSLIYTGCCREGRIVLPICKPTPQYLDTLLNPANGRISVLFRRDFRGYNCMFAFTSLGADIDRTLNHGSAPYVFKISGQVCHKMGSLLPETSDKPKFAQLYVVDTDNEVENRLNALSGHFDEDASRLNALSGHFDEDASRLDPSIVRDLIIMLDANNELVQFFHTVRDKFVDNSIPSFSIRLLERRQIDSRQYDLPTSDEIGCLIPGDIGLANANRDIIVQQENGPLKRISCLHPKFMALQYPLLFPHGDDGYMKDLFQRPAPSDDHTKKKRISMRCFYAFQLQDRSDQNITIQKGGRLFQQYLVDVYATVEENRLHYIRTNQENLRSDVYKGIYDALSRGENNAANIGQKVILPSSFTGSPRYMIANYQDAMAICRRFGNPDLFITFTCNAKWPEIERELHTKPGYKAGDRPDLVTRVFKMKFDKLMQYIKYGIPFGEVQADVSTIEFQKRGLPHAHMLFWLKSEYKCYSPKDVDSIISAEIPNKDVDPILYDIVSQCMMHGPCGEFNHSSPCMVDKRCSKFFPKNFSPCTSIDSTISPTYMRRDDPSKFVEKNGIRLDNRHVVPYNSDLLLKFHAHINVESCSHSMLIKYLFKYITKGPDRSRVVFEEDLNDEVATYLNCRYIEAHEAVWRLMEYPIHSRHPAVERLAVHLPLDNKVTFHKNRPLHSICDDVMLRKTMLTEWFTANQIHVKAHSLTYVQFPTGFVWKAGDKYWKPRERDNGTMGRLAYVHPSSGELYFMHAFASTERLYEF